jgi:phage tail-like protein
MARPHPYTNFRFRVEIDGLSVAAFNEVRIGACRTEVIDYREGSDVAHVRKLPGLTSYGNITLQRGISTSLELFNWHKQIANGQFDNARRNLTIVLQDETGTDTVRFVVRNAWPVRYEVGELDAQGGAVAIEAIELTNEGIERDT